MSIPYTQNAREVLRLAEEAAKENGSGYVGTEHLLLGMIREQAGVASQVLKNNGITEEKLKDMISSLRLEEGKTAVMDRDGYTPRLRDILDGAMELAEEQYHVKELGTEFFLLATILERQNVALKLMEAAGANVPKIYFETLAAMGGKSAGAPAGSDRRSAAGTGRRCRRKKYAGDVQPRSDRPGGERGHGSRGRTRDGNEAGDSDFVQKDKEQSLPDR